METISNDVLSVETILAREGADFFLFVGTKEGWTLRAAVVENGNGRHIDVYDRNGDKVGSSEAPLTVAKEKAVLAAFHHHLLRH